MPISFVNSWGETMASATGALPTTIIGFLVMLVIGWFIAGLFDRALATILRMEIDDPLGTRLQHDAALVNMQKPTSIQNLAKTAQTEG